MTRARVADAVGLLLVVTAIGTASASVVITGDGDARAVVAMLAAAAVAHVLGRLLAPVLEVVVALVVSSIALLILLEEGALSGYPIAPPLGYANANAALYVQAAALAALAAVTVTRQEWRTAALASAVGLVLVTAVTGSLAGLLTGALVLVAAKVGSGRRDVSRGVGATASLVVVLLAHLAVFVLAVSYRPGATERSAAQSAAASSLSDRRLDLWHDAVQISFHNPLSGVGFGRFPAASETAQLDLDTQEAHSVTLQWAAETGWVGALAVLGLLMWMAVRPFVTGSVADPPAAALVSAAAAIGFALHASVDYVASFPFVVVLAAFVSGAGTALASVEEGAIGPYRVAG